MSELSPPQEKIESSTDLSKIPLINVTYGAFFGFIAGGVISNIYQTFLYNNISEEKRITLHNYISWIFVYPIMYIFAALTYPFIFFVKPEGVWPDLTNEQKRDINIALYFIITAIGGSYLGEWIQEHIF